MSPEKCYHETSLGFCPFENAQVPCEVKLALHVILNHVEPGWENCKAVLNHWLDSLPDDASNLSKVDADTVSLNPK